MNSSKLLLISIFCSCLQGCAGYLNAWTNDPFQHHRVRERSIFTMTGDRRTAVFTDRDSTLKYCAESLPDAVAALAASSTASLNATGLGGNAGGEAKISDATTISLLQTFQRTEIAELSRQLGWSTCMAWSQGAISDEQYHAILKDIVAGSIEVMKMRASQPQNMPAAAQSNGSAPSKPDAKPEAKVDPKP